MKKALGVVGHHLASALAIKTEGWKRADVIRLVFAVALFFSFVLAGSRWWQWKHGTVALHSPIVWTSVTLAVFLLAPDRPLVIVGSLGICILYGLKGAILDQLVIGWGIVAGCIILGTIIVAAFPEAFEEYSQRRIFWGSRIKKND